MPGNCTKPRGKKGRKLPAYLHPLITKASSLAPKEFMICRSRKWFDAHEALGSGAFGSLVTQVHAVQMLKCIEHNNRLCHVHAKDGISECRQIHTAPIAYDAIVASFNVGTQIEKFIEWVKPNPNNPNGPTGYTLDHLLALSPTSQGLRIDMKFLFDPHQLDIPGYIVISEHEYNKTHFLSHQILFQCETAKEKAIQHCLDKKAGLWKDSADSHTDRYAYGADTFDGFLSGLDDDLPEFIEGSAGSVDAEGDPDPDHRKGVEGNKGGLLYYVDTEGNKTDVNGDSAMKNASN
ncbi:hypothetical protein ARMGADRAFT_1091936 [Armillaria gallica]|uniref:Uncharacterized protein n=1 Tax=Armillaria gallica TaxID=47427 RepID=A0A2H3CHE9_ARMGA|nr:hypothetical protein ARMGADRAFT_1091936 [Armillaria gallica]